MNTLDAIYSRRSVKHFDSRHRLTVAEENTLLEAAIQAPTSFNCQHWRFIILRDPALREQICKQYANDQAQLTDASMLVLFTADVKAWNKAPERYWVNAPKEVGELMVSLMGPFHEGRDWLQRDEAQRSMGMGMQTLMLATQELGYQSCPIIGYDIDAVARLVNLPDDHVMGPMIAIGKGIKDPWPKAGQLPLSEVVFENSF